MHSLLRQYFSGYLRLELKNNQYEMGSCFLIVACKPGTYGLGCSSKCEDCLQGTVCLPENGTCPNGCNEPGFYIRSSDLAKCDYIG